MTSEVLRAARALIDTPEKWSPDGWGDGDTRCAVHALDSTDGVLRHLSGQVHVADPAFQALSRAMGGYPGDFNDSHTHAEVMAAYDRAIAHAEAAEAEFTVQPTREPVTV
jgi:hypothetical protein